MKLLPNMNKIMAAAVVALSFSSIKAAIIASDDFESYTVGTRNLIGQPAGGFGFAGNWQATQGSLPPYGYSMDVFNDGTIGTNGSGIGNAQSYAAFSSSIPIASRVFMKYDFIINGDNGIYDSTRIDLMGSTNWGLGSRVSLGAYTASGVSQFIIGVRDDFGSGDVDLATPTQLTGAVSGVTTIGISGKQVLIGMLDKQFNQIAIWVNPDSNDFYDPSTGQSSADGVSAWSFTEADLPELYGIGAIQIKDTKIGFDNFVLATEFSDFVSAVPEPSSTALLALGGLAVMMRRRR